MLTEKTTIQRPPQHEALEQAGANAINSLVDYGATVIILCVALGFAVFANVLQFRRNNDLVDKLFNIIPTTTAAVIQAVADFKEALRGLDKED